MGSTAFAEPLHVSALDDLGDSKPGAVNKALSLLDVFRGHGPMGVSEIARRAHIAKSTAFRLLAHLEEAGFVERVGTDYRLGWRLFELGNGVRHCQPRGLRDVAAPYLGDLFARTQVVVQLAVLDGTDVMYLDKVYGPGSPKTPSIVGGRVPATCTALGKAILAFSDRETVEGVLRGGLIRRTRYSIAEPGRLAQQLRQVRVEGVAYDREESALGLVCVAAPIVVNGRAEAAVSVSGPATRFDVDAVAGLVRRAAVQISRECPAGTR